MLLLAARKHMTVHIVGPPDVMEHGVAVRPHDADLKKAYDERDVDRPFLDERRAQSRTQRLHRTLTS
jgi:hypothetical protein